MKTKILSAVLALWSWVAMGANSINGSVNDGNGLYLGVTNLGSAALRNTNEVQMVSVFSNGVFICWATNINLIGQTAITNSNGNVSVDITPGAAAAASWKYQSSTVLSSTNGSGVSNVVSFTLPANTLGTTNQVTIEAFGDMLNNGGSITNFTLAVQYGATTVWQSTAAKSASATRYPFRIIVNLFAINSTSSQEVNGMFFGIAGGAATTGTGPLTVSPGTPIEANFEGTSAEDSTADKTFLVTCQWQAATANTDFRIHRVNAFVK